MTEDYTMAITTLLAVHSTEEPIDNVDSIIATCSEIDAHLNLVVFGTMQTIPTAAYGGMPDYYLTDERDGILTAARERAAEVEKRIQATDLSASVLVECVDVGLIGSTMSRHALYADATVFANRCIPAEDHPTRAFNGILFDSGQPVIILGAADKPLAGVKRVIMAWNSEPEAARAIHRSVPLLSGAEEVRVVLVDPDFGGSEASPGNDMAAFLTRHDLTVTVDQLPSGGREIADVLLQHAVDKDADMIVMGAYGHSRLREWLLGGTTRDILSRAKIPILMVH